jgi:ABC-type sugar transport system permease subunit
VTEQKAPYPWFRWLTVALLAGGLSLFASIWLSQQTDDPLPDARWTAASLIRGWAQASLDKDGKVDAKASQTWLRSMQASLPAGQKLTSAVMLAEQTQSMFGIVLRKIRFVVHLDKKRQGKELDKESKADKALFDLSGNLKSRKKQRVALEVLNKQTLVQAAVLLPQKGKSPATLILQLPVLKAKSNTKGKSRSSAALLFSWLLACLGMAVVLAFVRGPFGHGFALVVVVSAALYPYVFAVDQMQHKQEQVWKARQQLLQKMVTQTPAPSKKWLSRVSVTPAPLAFAWNAKTPKVSIVKQQIRNQIDIKGIGWNFLFAGLFALLFYALYAFGWMERFFRTIRLYKAAYAYVSPAMVGMLVLVFVPFAIGIGLSFFKHLGGGKYEWVGFRNFLHIFFDPLNPFPHALNFYYTLFITLLWTFLNVFLHVSIGLGLALLLKNPLLRMKSIYRVLLILPWAIPNYITALIWKGMFHQQFGAVNTILDKIGLFTLLGIERVSWFSNAATAFTANLVTNTWLGFPFMMVVSLGALQSIPGDLYEAADVDGASGWQKFRYITLPLLKPALFPAIILGCIWTFNMFNIIYLVSGGNPGGATDILITEAYNWAFKRGDRYGYAAAYSTIIFLILLSYSLITNRATRATEGV